MARYDLPSLVHALEAAAQASPLPVDCLRAVAGAYSVKTDAMLRKSRQQSISAARQTAAYVLRNRLGMSYPSIARHLHLSDHTSALHADRKISAFLEENDVSPPWDASDMLALQRHRVVAAVEAAQQAATPHQAMQAICCIYGVSLDDIKNGKGDDDHIRAGEMMAYALRRQFSLSYPSIGDHLQRHHTTIIAAEERMAAYLLQEGVGVQGGKPNDFDLEAKLRRADGRELGHAERHAAGIVQEHLHQQGVSLDLETIARIGRLYASARLHVVSKKR